MKRMILVLAVAALMAAMVVATAAPAFANNGVTYPSNPGQNGGGPPNANYTPGQGPYVYPHGGGETCVKHFGYSHTYGKQTGGGAYSTCQL